MNENDNIDLIKVGDYIIVQRQGFFKLHQLSAKCDIMLGKDKVNLNRIIGMPFWTMFRMIPRKGNKREFDLDVCTEFESIPDIVRKDIKSGVDNRNITDDGSSQLLSSDEINGMRESGHTAQEIVGKLIENSKTFKEKTEYSQEKYLKKKEKKYFEYIIIRRPNIRLLSNIFYTRDQFKVMGLRHDVLAQIFTLSNLHHNGTYLLFETGTQALIGAGILNSLSDGGLLINLTVGNHPQKQAILGMNFNKTQMSRFLSVKIKNLIDYLCGNNLKSCKEATDSSLPDEISPFSKETTNEEAKYILSNEINISSNEPSNKDSQSTQSPDEIKSFSKEESNEESHKRKLSDGESPVLKKPRWTEEFETAVNLLKVKKVDGIIIASKEYPLNLLTKLIKYLKDSCPLVIYCLYREPLMQLYVELKKRRDFVGLHLIENVLRGYQVLPERTHPDITLSSSGYLLSAIKVSTN